MTSNRPANPRIVVTVAVPADQPEPAIAAEKNRLYADSVARHGAAPIVLDATTSPAEREAAFALMDGLLLTGGADVDPALYDHPVAGSVAIERARDILEREAWLAAEAREAPVLGICRGFQAINVFAGGTLLQHVDDHASASWGHGPAKRHPLRLETGSRLARILAPTKATSVLSVNSYHHQAVRPSDLAPGFVASAWAPSPAGELIEAFEAIDGRFVAGVQCHPERTESTPAEFERLFAFFVDACRGPMR